MLDELTMNRITMENDLLIAVANAKARMRFLNRDKKPNDDSNFPANVSRADFMDQWKSRHKKVRR